MRFGPVLLVLAAATRLAAHPLAPSLLELHERDAGRIDVEWKVPAARVPRTTATPLLPSRCREVSPHETVTDGLGIRARWAVDCGSGIEPGDTIGVRDVEAAGAVVRVVFRDGRVVQHLVLPGDREFSIPPAPRAWEAIGAYVRLGMSHILTGPDHLLFVFGLVLLSGTFRRVVTTVTAFTLGHSLTLAAAVLGLVALPQLPIEIAIAASVFALAVELAREPSATSPMRRRPWTMAVLFGLLHGLGFAAALTDAGLARAEVPMALVGFNAGIEAGQVLFVTAVLVLRRLLARPAARMPGWTSAVPVYAMGSLAAFWWLERTMALFR